MRRFAFDVKLKPEEIGIKSHAVATDIPKYQRCSDTVSSDAKRKDCHMQDKLGKGKKEEESTYVTFPLMGRLKSLTKLAQVQEKMGGKGKRQRFGANGKGQTSEEEKAWNPPQTLLLPKMAAFI